MKKIPEKFLPWIEAPKRYHLSDAHIQMARELGLNPKKFGGLANTRQEPWKAPLPEFIEELYFKHFNKTRPEKVRSIEQMVSDFKRKKAERKVRKQTAAQSQPSDEEEVRCNNGDADRPKPIACRRAPTSLLERSLLKRVRDTRQGCRESLTPGAGSGQAQEAIGLALLTTPIRAATMIEVIVPLVSK